MKPTHISIPVALLIFSNACALGLAAAQTFAATIEVDTAAAFNTSAATAKPGDEILVRDGVYDDWKLAVPAKGTPAEPVTIRPQTPGGVLFRRATEITVSGDSIELRGFHFEHCGAMAVNIVGQLNRVTGCRFVWCGNPRSTFSHIVEIGDSAHDNRVDHCHFEGSKSMSVGLRITPGKAGQRNRVDHNVFRDIFPLSSNGQEPVQLGQGSAGGDSFTVVEFNLFDNASGDPEFISNKSSHTPTVSRSRARSVFANTCDSATGEDLRTSNPPPFRTRSVPLGNAWSRHRSTPRSVTC